MSKRIPTIHDVAKSAGVSIATVSYVLNGTGRFSEETASKVTAAVKKLGYKPNRQAAGLKNKRSHTIGLVISTIENDELAEVWTSISSEILYRLSATAISRGYSLIMIPSENLNSLSQIGIDALVVSDSRIEDPAIAAAHKLGIPVGTNERPNDPRVALTIDDGYWDMTQAALNHLKSKGATNIGLLTEPVGSLPDQRITDSYLDWCQRNSNTPLIEHGNYSKTDTEACVKKLMSQGADAIYSYYEEGPEILQALERSGLHVPRDVLLISVALGNDEENKKLGISSIIYNPTQHIESFTNKLIDIIEKKEVGPITLYSDWSLNTYESTKD